MPKKPRNLAVLTDRPNIMSFDENLLSHGGMKGDDVSSEAAIALNISELTLESVGNLTPDEIRFVRRFASVINTMFYLMPFIEGIPQVILLRVHHVKRSIEH